MSWLFEDPTLVLVMGALALAALAIVFMKTGRITVLLVMLGVGLLAGACILVEFLVVTEREEVEVTLDGITAAFRANDAAGVQQFISPRATTLRRRVAWVLNTVEIQEVKITDGPRIEVHSLTSPRSATAELIAVARGKLKVGANIRDQYPAKLIISLTSDGDRWLIESVEEDLPFGARD